MMHHELVLGIDGRLHVVAGDATTVGRLHELPLGLAYHMLRFTKLLQNRLRARHVGTALLQPHERLAHGVLVGLAAIAFSRIGRIEVLKAALNLAVEAL